MNDKYAQHGEVEWLESNWARLGLPSRGVFVDVGAFDGLTHSNTAWLEKSKGWSGVVIEADPRSVDALRRNRGCAVANCAIGSGSAGMFALHNTREWAGFLRSNCPSVWMPMVRLDAVLVAHGIKHIDVLSIDTEGTEIDVLKTIDLALWRVAVILVEWNTAEQPPHFIEIECYLTPKGYTRLAVLGGNLAFFRPY